MVLPLASGSSACRSKRGTDLFQQCSKVETELCCVHIPVAAGAAAGVGSAGLVAVAVAVAGVVCVLVASAFWASGCLFLLLPKRPLRPFLSLSIPSGAV